MRRDVKAYEIVEMDSRSKEKLLALANERKVALKQENTYLGRIRSFGTVRNVVSVSTREQPEQASLLYSCQIMSEEA